MYHRVKHFLLIWCGNITQVGLTAGQRRDMRRQLCCHLFDRRFFHCEYHGDLEEYQKKRADARTYDHNVIYGG